MENGSSGLPTGTIQSRHYDTLNHDITGSAKCPPEKQTSIHWTVEPLCMDSS